MEGIGAQDKIRKMMATHAILLRSERASWVSRGFYSSQRATISSTSVLYHWTCVVVRHITKVWWIQYFSRQVQYVSSLQRFIDSSQGRCSIYIPPMTRCGQFITTHKWDKPLFDVVPGTHASKALQSWDVMSVTTPNWLPFRASGKTVQYMCESPYDHTTVPCQR